MKTTRLLALAAAFGALAVSAFADIPSPPSLTATKLAASNLNLVYNLASVTETKLGDNGKQFPDLITTYQKILRGYTLSDRRADAERSRALICTRSEQIWYGGRASNSYECRQITATNMKLPASDADLLAIKVQGDAGEAR